MTKDMKDRTDSVGVQWMDQGEGYFAGRGADRFPLAYIALPEGHPDVGKSYNEVATGENDDWGPEVNGGLTFSKGNVFGWDYGHAFNSFDIDGDIQRAVDYFRARATAGAAPLG
jgi:hypothetical protein